MKTLESSVRLFEPVFIWVINHNLQNGSHRVKFKRLHRPPNERIKRTESWNLFNVEEFFSLKALELGASSCWEEALNRAAQRRREGPTWCWSPADRQGSDTHWGQQRPAWITRFSCWGQTDHLFSSNLLCNNSDLWGQSVEGNNSPVGRPPADTPPPSSGPSRRRRNTWNTSWAPSPRRPCRPGPPRCTTLTMKTHRVNRVCSEI